MTGRTACPSIEGRRAQFVRTGTGAVVGEVVVGEGVTAEKMWACARPMGGGACARM